MVNGNQVQHEPLKEEEMSSSVLVAYSTRYGSTREVAERITRVLRRGGADVHLEDARKVRALDGHSAVIVGAPIYMGNLGGGTRAFLTRHRKALEHRPFALFAVGPIGESPANPDQLMSILAAHQWPKPGEVALFGGRFDPSHLNFFDRVVTGTPASPLHGVSASDARDWDAVEAWAHRVGQLLPGKQASR